MKNLKLKSIFFGLTAFTLVFFFQNASAQHKVGKREKSEHLVSNDKLRELKAKLVADENLSELDLKKILSAEEIKKLSRKKLNSSGAVTIFSTGCYRLMKFCKPPFGDCTYYWEDICLSY